MEKNLRVLASDYCENKIFGTWQLQENETFLISSIFMPLIFMEEEDMVKLKKEACHLYGFYSDTFHRSVNGFPIFHSFGCLNPDEYKAFSEFVNEIQKFKDAFLEKGKS